MFFSTDNDTKRPERFLKRVTHVESVFLQCSFCTDKFYVIFVDASLRRVLVLVLVSHDQLGRGEG